MWKLKTALLAWALATWLNTQAQAQDTSLESSQVSYTQEQVKKDCWEQLDCLTSSLNESDPLARWKALIYSNPRYTKLYEEYLEQLSWSIEKTKNKILKVESRLAELQDSWNTKKIASLTKFLNKGKNVLLEYQESPKILLWLPEMRIVDTMNVFEAIWDVKRAGWYKTQTIGYFHLLSSKVGFTEDELKKLTDFLLVAEKIWPEVVSTFNSIISRDSEESRRRLAESEKNLKFALLFKDL